MQNTAILVTGHGLGQADPALRLKLAANYFLTLAESGLHPQAILFYGEGVKLCTHGSPCLEGLQRLTAAGVPLILCRTCLDFYGLLDAVEVGEIGNMLRIVEAQQAATKVITV